MKLEIEQRKLVIRKVVIDTNDYKAKECPFEIHKLLVSIECDQENFFKEVSDSVEKYEEEQDVKISKYEEIE